MKIETGILPVSFRGHTWHQATGGPTAAANAPKLGHGHVLDRSVIRQRPLDVAAPRAKPPSLVTMELPTHKHNYKHYIYNGRFALEPTELPGDGLHATRSYCETAEKGNTRLAMDFGVRKFPNAPTMQSTVDSVVFNRDMDFSGETKFDEDFTAMFDGMAGMPSWHWGR